LTTYLPRGLPPIKAADLNAIQNAINRNFLGTYTHFGLVLDGKGGSDVVPTAGALAASGTGTFGGLVTCPSLQVNGDGNLTGKVTVGASAGGSALPGTPITKASVYAESCLLAMAIVKFDGTFVFGFNIASIDWRPNLIGMVLVQLATPAESANTMVPLTSSYSSNVSQVFPEVRDNRTIAVTTTDLRGVGTHASFSLVVFGR
jgi:hypothetical protein